MTEKEFMKQVAHYNMPNISEIKESCISELNHPPKISRRSVRIYRFAAIALVVLFLFITPVNSIAQNIMEQIQTILQLNEEPIALGDMDYSSIKIPDGCEKVVSNGVTYFTKAYHSLSDLQKDIQSEIYTWNGSNDFFEDGIMLNIVKNDYGRITLLYDVMKERVIDTDVDAPNIQSVTMFIYFPLSAKTTLGDIMLQDERLKYSTIDDEGNIEKYTQNTEYELVEKYKSNKLDTTVTVISEKTTFTGSGDDETTADSDTSYYLYFTLDGMCYQINCDGTLKGAHAVIDGLQKVSAPK